MKVAPLRLAGLAMLCVLGSMLPWCLGFVVGLVYGCVSETISPTPKETYVVEKIVEVPAAAGATHESR